MPWFRWRAGRPGSAWPRTCADSTPTRSTSPRYRASTRSRMSNAIIEKYADADALVSAAGDRLVGAITAAIDTRGVAYIVLAGGGSGVKILQHMSDHTAP